MDHARASSGVFALIVSGVLSALFASAASAEKYHKWTDDSGVVHYSKEKPTDRDSEETMVLRSTGEARSSEAGESEIKDPLAAAKAAGAFPGAAVPPPAEPSREKTMICTYATGGLETAERFYLAAKNPETGTGLRPAEEYAKEMQEMRALKMANCAPGAGS